MARSGHEKNQRHQDHASRNENEDNVRHMSARASEQASQIGRSAMELGEQSARVGADVLKRNAETIQSAWQSGQEMATALVEHTTDQLGRRLGVSGDEAQQVTERSVRNAEVIINSGAAVSELVSGMSREYSDFARSQLEKSIERMNDLWRCRTPQEVAAVQGDFLRDMMTGALEITRRLTDISGKLVDDAARRAQDIGRRAA